MEPAAEIETLEMGMASMASANASPPTVDALRPFWTPFCTQTTGTLWLPSEIALAPFPLEQQAQDPLDPWTTSLIRQGRNSWFTVRVSTWKRPTSFLAAPDPSAWRALVGTDLQKIADEAVKEAQAKQKAKKKGKGKGKRKEKKAATPPTTSTPSASVSNAPDPPIAPETPPAELKARRIQVHPNKTQRELFQKWYRAIRSIYNSCVATTHAKGNPPLLSEVELYGNFAKDAAVMGNRKTEWMLDVPTAIRSQGVRDAIAAYDSNLAKAKKANEAGGSHHFTLHFRSERDEQTMNVRKDDWGRKRGMFASVFGASKLRTGKGDTLPEKLEHDSKLTRDRRGRFWLSIPCALASHPVRSQPMRVTSIDPGIRTFATGYDPDGFVWEWGAGDIGRIVRLCRGADKLQGKVAKAKGKVKRHLRKALLRAFERIRNLVREVHVKLTAWLCENYDLIILPEFGSARMVKRAGRKINSKTARSMLTWSHYGFRQYLMHKVREYPGVTKLCTEEYTSKTCGACGQLNDGLGGSKRFRCPNALCPLNNLTPVDADAARTLRAAQRTQKRRPTQGARKQTPPKEPASVRLTMDRDANGARNILLKALAEATGGEKPPRPPKKAAGKRTPRKAKAVNARKQGSGVIPELHLNGDGAPAAAAPTQLSGAKRTQGRSPTTHVGGTKRRCIGAAAPAPQDTRRPQRGDIAASSLVREPEDASGFSADAEDAYLYDEDSNTRKS
jgi:putative transposase